MQLTQQRLDEIFAAHQSGNFELLLKLSKQFQQDFPTNLLGYKAEGVALLSLGKISEALKVMKQAVKIDPYDDEASSNLGRLDGIRYGYRAKDYKDLNDLFRKSRSEGFGPEVKRRIILGTYVLSSGYYDAYYKKAQQVRTFVRKEFEKNFEKYDVLLTPVVPTTAFDIGSKTSNPLEMYLADICTVSINVAGVPAISVPCGVDKQGMPIGMQLIGNKFQEETILNAAYTFEQETKFREKYRPEFKK